jgi:hypothetical protein
MAGLATLAAVPRSAGSERDADQARCDRCLRAVTHGHAEICSAARSQCGEPRPGTGPADPAACTLCPWRGQGPDLARHCARVRDRRSRTGSPAVTATYRRGKAGVATAPGEAGPGPRPVAPKPRAVWIGSSRRPAVRYRRPAGHASLPKASVAQPAATARARLSASPSAAGSAKAAWHPATAHQAAGTRIWSPMTQRPVIATG